MDATTVSGILHTIVERHSSRMPFDPHQPVRTGDLKMVLEAARWAPTAHNMQNYEIVVVDDHEKLEEIGRIQTVSSETFIRENYRQLSFSKEELLKKKTGILAAGFPSSWTREEAKEGKVSEEDRRGSMGGWLEGTPVLLLVVIDPRQRAPDSEGDRWGVISLGCLMENMWLMAESLGLGFHVIVAFGEGKVEAEVKRILDIPGPLKIAYGCRLGHAQVARRPYFRVRRETKDFVHHNGWDEKGIH